MNDGTKPAGSGDSGTLRPDSGDGPTPDLVRASAPDRTPPPPKVPLPPPAPDSGPPACPVGGARALTPGEVDLARSIFGDAIDYPAVTINRRKWMFFQPRRIVMAPRGHIHFHPKSPSYCDDFSAQPLSLQGLFIHEMTHVWQAQTKGRWWLIFHRMPWAPYDYAIKPGWQLEQYGVEQQAEIVKHAFYLRQGGQVAGVALAENYAALVNFPGTEVGN